MGRFGGSPGRGCTTHPGDPGLISARVVCSVSFPSIAPCFLSSTYAKLIRLKKRVNPALSFCERLEVELYPAAIHEDSGTFSFPNFKFRPDCTKKV